MNIAKFHFVTRNASKMQILTSFGQTHEICKVSLLGMHPRRNFSILWIKSMKIVKFHFLARNASEMLIFTSLGQTHVNCNVSLRGTECIKSVNFHIFGSNTGILQNFTSWHGMNTKRKLSHLLDKHMKIAKFHFMARDASKA